MRVKLAFILAFVLGLTLFVALLVYQGAAGVGLAVSSVGWGLALITAFHLVPLAADTIGWWRLFDRPTRPSLLSLIRLKWICEGVNSLLPVARVGGEIVRARLVSRLGVTGPLAGATVVVDLTMAILAQVVFVLVGVTLLVGQLDFGPVASLTFIGAALLGLLIGVFYFVQHRGLFGRLTGVLRRVVGEDRLGSLASQAHALDEAIVELYRDRTILLWTGLWRLIGWLTGAGEVWLALAFLGHPVTIAQAIMLESLGAAIRGAAFIVPGALGVQEGGLMVIGQLIGLPLDIALAMSLIKRVRELLLGGAALIVWQLSESRRAWRRRGAAGEAAAPDLVE